MCLYFMHTLALQDGPTENDTRECNTLCLSYILYIMLQKAVELGFTLGGADSHMEQTGMLVGKF